MHNPGDLITCVTWLSWKNDLQEVLCGGSGLGYLILWYQRADSAIKFNEVFSRWTGTGQEIMSISHHDGEGTTYIITETWDKWAQLWAMDAKLNLTTIFSVELPTIPQALYFHPTGIAPFGMFDGKM
ncbi:hypothetical protein JVU11DRAFT_2543 [Chiua virens]|nr:hypothetical protein JVU11DRAFT_2543 [Chiua virens]